MRQPHDAIDFTDNDIQALGNFPLSPRLRTLLLARNRVASIQASLANSIPNLTTLVLTSNNFAELADLDVLSSFSNLTHLILLENPVTRKEVRFSSQRMKESELLLMGGK
jgi:U2 small nuclear ribonucleoprotein A'